MQDLPIPITESLILALLYTTLGGLYLLIVPGATYLYLNRRWYTAGSVERLFMYFLVFLFFPGLLLLSPLLNFRLRGREG
ncbi:NADH dehydrogenase transmembrane subunit [Rubidibacter lacunae KORDI 51-2]|uniref:NAD(P)H-quinone oxidoreductase subunit L n=1 Tax=Rubidibacter lacunae KORDI 51-2 TaxID=582515 RepID=U5DF04_9CHRO|nr:NAD(P)H-quinone oxidoreductase subunit L [Rubidibacter lacunae]ERN40181.1 NADH dehydrogenase transmembrane subunit [Rubidibacter lacunae KORDI 51-2]